VKYNVYQLIDKLAYDYNDDELVNLFIGPKDYEGAARDEGWVGPDEYEGEPTTQEVYTDKTDGMTWCCPDWQELCEEFNIEPYETEVLEHWLVSDWLADKLIAKGETVVKDYMGLTIWGRTTSGQAISLDYVIQQIYQELVK
jgi:hypothetical protein